MKSGTASLYHYITQHPDIHAAAKKEVHYFDHNYSLGEKYYRSHFPLKKDVGAGRITGEASPMYLYNPLCAERIKSLLPAGKIIVILRNPTDRALSHYFHSCRQNEEELPILDAFQAEEERLQFVDFNKLSWRRTIKYHSYKSRGLYLEQLQRYLIFYSTDDMLIVDSDEMFLDPNYVLKDVFRFLSVSEYKIKNIEAKNVGSNRVDVESHVYDYLNEYYLDQNLELSKTVAFANKWII